MSRKYQRLKPIKQMYGPIKDGRIRVIIAYGNPMSGHTKVFEGDLDPGKNLTDLVKILFQERNEFKMGEIQWAEDATIKT